MDISFLGHASFKIRGKQATIITDPFDPSMVGLKFPKEEADIVTVSHSHNDHNKVELVAGDRRVVSGPGEYEIKGVTIFGYNSFHDDAAGSKRGKNTIYLIEFDGIRLLHLGDLGHVLDQKTLDEIGEVNIIFVPVGGEYTIGPKEASEVVRSLEPNIVIPMHYQIRGLNPLIFSKLAGVEEFLSLVSLAHENLPKLILKREDLAEEQKVVILEIR